MLLGIDHLDIAVRDLDEATRDFGALGFTVARGGRHTTGSHNADPMLTHGARLTTA